MRQRDLAFNVTNCKGNRALLAVGIAKCGSRSVSLLYDSLVRHRKARELGIRGRDINMTMIKVGNVKESFSTKECVIPLLDEEGNIVKITAIGIDEISTKISEIDMSEIASLFSGIITR